MKRKIIAYENYYKDFFDALDKNAQEKVLYGLLLLRTQDRLPAKFVKFIRNGLYELRIEWQSNLYRIFFCFDKDVLLYYLMHSKRRHKRLQRKKFKKH